MKKRLLLVGFSLVLGGLSSGIVAQSTLIESAVKNRSEIRENVSSITLQAPDMQVIKAEDQLNDELGMRYRIGVGTDVSISPANSGNWYTEANGDRVWQLKINYPGAEALSFMFSEFHLSGNATMDVLALDGTPLHKTYTAADVMDHGQQNMSLCYGDKMVLQLREPAGTDPSKIAINQIFYGYRGTGSPNVQKIGESDDCEVNVNCSPEGDDWKEEKRGVMRILVVDGGFQGWCSGSMVNNVRQDCKPYALTALHCGVTSTTANFNNWRFYFLYESFDCTTPPSAGTLDDHWIMGCVKLASSNDGGGDSGSDFLLVQIGSLANESNTITTLKGVGFNIYWNGWDANNTTSNAGVSIHHPAGDIKKISTYSSNLVTTGWGISGTHWRVSWVSSANGHGVTEGGSSGSPIFRYNGGNSHIMGTLTGGSSFCNTPGSPDAYGKMSYHWTSNGTPANEQLKTYLDPDNTGTLVLNGSDNPCAWPTVSVNEVNVKSIEVGLFPNPVNDELTIDLTSLSAEVSIEVYDLAGKKVLSTRAKGGELFKLNTGMLSKGLYEVNIRSTEGNVTKKVSKL